MEIGIDGGCLSNRRGFGRFARRLLDALSRRPTEHRFQVFLDRPSANEVRIPEAFERVLVEVREAPSVAASAQGQRRWRDLIEMGRAVARSRIDLMYFPATYTFFPTWNVAHVVITMHDMLALNHPELVFPGLRGRIAWQLKERLAVRWADRIITVSEASRRAITNWSGRAGDKIRVVTEAADPIFRPRAPVPEGDHVLRRFGLLAGEPYLLYVGGLSPHKNLLRLVDGFARAAATGVKLVLAGDLNDVFLTHVPEIRDSIATNHLESQVIMPGFVSDEDLVFLYGRAYALVLPSLLEGFGLPAVEAMACGTPVICSRAGSLPEVVGDAGAYFEPTDVASIAQEIRGLLADPARRDALSRSALERSALFSWDASAQALLDCFDELEDGMPRNSTSKGSRTIRNDRRAAPGRFAFRAWRLPAPRASRR
jgi:glycosyltransferase involved in cell wall biosynthesis